MKKVHVFREAKLLCVDIETKDNNLIKYGPGTHRGDGHICGVAMAAKDDQGELHQEYFSLTHPNTNQTKRDRNRALLRDILRIPMPKLGANIAYDVEWLTHEGFEVNGILHDVQYAEPLLNENAKRYNLNALARKYTLNQKKTNVLEDYNTKMGWSGKPIENIWRMPDAVAAEYALVDVELPMQIFEFQRRNLETQNLWDLYRMEISLIPILLEMRRNGVRLDMDLLGQAAMKATNVKFELEQKIHNWAGVDINIGSTVQLAHVFDEKGIHYPRNAPTSLMQAKGKTKGSPKLDVNVLTKLSAQHDICKDILRYRHYNTLINNFLHKYAEMEVDGRLYGQFHPLRSDEYGTVSGRFSSSKPNLQQVSAKKDKEEIEGLEGRIVRRLFVPEEGHTWVKADYSQVEYRIMAHYACGQGADELRESYQANKNMDYHQRIMELTGFNRRNAKRVNFGGAYGIGVKSACKLFGWEWEEGQAILNSFHKAAPYIKSTREAVQNAAARRGYIFTILNRRARVHSSRKLHSMFNRLIQGSAADVMKKAMVDCWVSGIFDVLKLHMTVHDELDVSKPPTKEGDEAVKEMVHLMENAVQFDVPLLVDVHEGLNWAEAD